MNEPMTSFIAWHCRECTRTYNAPTVGGVPDWSLPTGWTHGNDRFARAQCPACSNSKDSTK